MKALVCEICGGNDLIKQDGYFVCQHCGTKYSVEEARKMMVEGTVDVSGSTVKVDDSDELEKLYQVARRARDEDNAANAARYYDSILMKDPSSWEAAFYVVYFQAKQCKIAEIASAGFSVARCIGGVMELIRDHVEGDEQQLRCLQELSVRCLAIAAMLYQGAVSHYNGISSQIRSNYQLELTRNCAAAQMIPITFGDQAEKIFGDREAVHPLSVDAWKVAISMKVAETPQTREMLTAKIRKYEPDYAPPEPKAQGGCYVATCVYGSYDCPQVWTLRRFRDNMLAESRPGRAFIRVYYAVSPTLVKWFGGDALVPRALSRAA